MPTDPTTYVQIFPATLGFVWGVPTAEAGINIDSVTNSVKTEEFQQKNSVGETIAAVTFNPVADISISGETMGTTFTQVAGSPVTLTNLINLGGVATGLVLCKTVEISQGRAKMQSVKITATRYPLIPAGP